MRIRNYLIRFALCGLLFAANVSAACLTVDENLVFATVHLLFAAASALGCVYALAKMFR
jgi:hypothetical protein